MAQMLSGPLGPCPPGMHQLSRQHGSPRIGDTNRVLAIFSSYLYLAVEPGISTAETLGKNPHVDKQHLVQDRRCLALLVGNPTDLGHGVRLFCGV